MISAKTAKSLAKQVVWSALAVKSPDGAPLPKEVEGWIVLKPLNAADQKKVQEQYDDLVDKIRRYLAIPME